MLSLGDLLVVFFFLNKKKGGNFTVNFKPIKIRFFSYLAKHREGKIPAGIHSRGLKEKTEQL